MDKIKYSVDQIIDDIVTLEEVETGVKKEERLINLPSGIYDGSVVLFDGEKYATDTLEEEKRRLDLRSRVERLKKLKSNGVNNE